MFLQNKYTKWYHQIINNAKNRRKISGYVEKHHILPKSLGGPDSPENKVCLTAREHFVVHKLLIRMTIGKEKSKMAYAFCCFFLGSHKNSGRFDLCFTAKDYEQKRKVLAKAVSDIHKGKKISQTTIQKMTETRRRNNKPFPEETRKIHSEATKKRWKENYDTMRQALQSETSKKKISDANKGKDRLSKQKRKELTQRNTGSGNGRAKHIIVTSPDGTIFHCHGNFQTFCKEHKLPFSTMCHILHKTRTFKKGATVGWIVNHLLSEEEIHFSIQ